jgi:D-alanine-D-alanine ligase
MIKKKTIAIIFGALSFEHEISIISAITMKNVLKSDLVYIFIDKHREFYKIPISKMKSIFFSNNGYKKCEKLQLAQGGFFQKSMFGLKLVKFDFALNLVHGGDGEDGVLASMFDFFNISFIGPRLEASVLSCNKNLTKYYAKSCGVKTIESKYFHKNDKIHISDYPVIIKPTKLGSSIGVSIVKKQSQLNYALDVAFEFDDTIIVEPFIDNVKEFNLAGCKVDGEFKFSIIEEPHKKEFLDFDQKYLDFNRTNKVTKADITDILEFELKQTFQKIYNTTFEGSLIRCDFFVINDEVFLNEINPIPGSMANYLFDDFNTILNKLSQSQPTKKMINITYDYVNKIQNAKV